MPQSLNSSYTCGKWFYRNLKDLLIRVSISIIYDQVAVHDLKTNETYFCRKMNERVSFLVRYIFETVVSFSKLIKIKTCRLFDISVYFMPCQFHNHLNTLKTLPTYDGQTKETPIWSKKDYVPSFILAKNY